MDSVFRKILLFILFMLYMDKKNDIGYNPAMYSSMIEKKL